MIGSEFKFIHFKDELNIQLIHFKDELDF